MFLRNVGNFKPYCTKSCHCHGREVLKCYAECRSLALVTLLTLLTVQFPCEFKYWSAMNSVTMSTRIATSRLVHCRIKLFVLIVCYSSFMWLKVRRYISGMLEICTCSAVCLWFRFTQPCTETHTGGDGRCILTQVAK
jgi:hypothetical protein